MKRKRCESDGDAMNLIPYLVFAIQARLQHKRYGVSAEYMELVLRIEWHKEQEHWSEERYRAELITLTLRYPDDVRKHFEYKQKQEGLQQ
jgi:hypothetical protein